VVKNKTHIMKIFLTIIGLAAVTLAGAQAAILIQDNFPTNGDLVGTTPSTGGIWTTISGTAGTLDVASGAVSILAGNNEDGTSQFASAQTGDVFAGFNFTMTTLPTTTSTGEYFASFRDGTPASGTYNGRLFARRITGSPANEFQIGVSNATGNVSDAGAVLWGSNLTLNVNYRIVLRFDTAAGDDMTLWVNPTTIASTNVTSTDADPVTSMDGFAFRQASAAHGAASIDNLIVATTFAEAIPEPSTWALIALGSAFMLWNIRRRRTANG